MKARSLLFLRSAFGLALCVALPGISAAQTRTLRADVDVTPDIQGDINTAVSNLGRQTIADVLPEPWKNWNGSRRWLAERGVTFAATYQNDIMAAISGGAKRGSTYYGRLLGTVEWDPEYATGWKGATFHFSFWQMHGVGISTHFVQSLSALSDLEGVATTRWSDVWLEQKFGDLLAVRAGKISADTEFFQSLFYGLGIGGAFGWAAILGANLPNGGIAFPFASPGVRVKITPHPQWTFLTAVFDGDPVGPGTGNPQIRNRYGTNFRLRDPAFAMAEAQWNYSTEWPGTLRLGAWKHFGRFPDQRFAADGRSLSDPASVGASLMHQGDVGFYGVFDQQIYQIDGKSTAGAFVFSRVAAAPSDRNLIDFLIDGGISFQGVVPGRPNDQFGFLGSFARVSRQARLADLDANRFNASYAPLRNYEAILQATYAYNVTDGFVLQPHVQYVLHPGAGTVDPTDPLGVRPLRDAFVAGLRMSFNY